MVPEFLGRIRQLLTRTLQRAAETDVAEAGQLVQGMRSAAVDARSADEALVQEVRRRAGLPVVSTRPELLAERGTEARQLDDISDRYWNNGRHYGTEPVVVDAAQLRTEPADPRALIAQAQERGDRLRLVVGGGLRYRPAEAGEVFVNLDPAERPDLVANFRHLYTLPSRTFDEVYLENVEMGVQRHTTEGLMVDGGLELDGGASELGRVLRDGGRLLIKTGPRYGFFGAGERAATTRALEEAGFGSIDFALFPGPISGGTQSVPWAEITAIKNRTPIDDGVVRLRRPS